MKTLLWLSIAVLGALAAEDGKEKSKQEKRSLEPTVYIAANGQYGISPVYLNSLGSIITPAISYSSASDLFSSKIYKSSLGNVALIGRSSFPALEINTGVTGKPLITKDSHEYRTVTEKVPVAVPTPYPVTVTNHVPVPQPYTVSVPKPYAVPFHVNIPVEVPRPYAVKIPHPVHVPVAVRVPVEIPKPYPVYRTQEVKVEIEKPVFVKEPVEVKVPVPQPYKVEVPTPVAVKVPHPVIVREPHVIFSGVDQSGFIQLGGSFGNDIIQGIQGFGGIQNSPIVGVDVGGFGSILEGGSINDGTGTISSAEDSPQSGVTVDEENESVSVEAKSNFKSDTTESFVTETTPLQEATPENTVSPTDTTEEDTTVL